jgi:4-hydroxy-tetrahydrodipicolinate reductase
MKRILLTGCNGKMGQMIAECTVNFPELEIVAGIDVNDTIKQPFPVYKSPDNVTFAVDAVIDFSHPSLLEGVLNYAEKYNVPSVIATTGLSPEQTADIKNAGKNIPIFHTANMSIGINLICELLKTAAPILYDNFDIEIIEKHHNRKLDAPSGTAILLADTIKNSVDTKLTNIYDRHLVRKRREHTELGIHSIRGGTIVGEHEVIFAGEDEVISLSHSASSRKVFAMGALRASLFIIDKAPGVYNMSDLLKEKL